MILAGGLDRGVILGPRPIYGVVAPLLIGVGLGWLPGGGGGVDLEYFARRVSGIPKVQYVLERYTTTSPYANHYFNVCH